jgi:hypothetical protein
VSLVWNNAKLIRGRSDEFDIVGLVNELRDKLVEVEASIPAPSGNSRVFLGERTGVGPWQWTGLNGDLPGLRGYEILFRVTKAAVAGHSLALQFNGDTGANYTDVTGFALTSVPVAAALVGSVESTEGMIRVPFARSGAYRNVTTEIQTAEDAPRVRLTGTQGAWLSAAAIARIDVINDTGTVDDGTFALYALMDVA